MEYFQAHLDRLSADHSLKHSSLLLPLLTLKILRPKLKVNSREWPRLLLQNGIARSFPLVMAAEVPDRDSGPNCAPANRP